jgi:hypothetical protein
VAVSTPRPFFRSSRQAMTHTGPSFSFWLTTPQRQRPSSSSSCGTRSGGKAARAKLGRRDLFGFGRSWAGEGTFSQRRRRASNVVGMYCKGLVSYVSLESRRKDGMMRGAFSSPCLTIRPSCISPPVRKPERETERRERTKATSSIRTWNGILTSIHLRPFFNGCLFLPSTAPC